MDKKRENLWTIMAVFLLTGLLGIAYFYKTPLKSTADNVVHPNAACDLRKASCSLVLPAGGEVRFSIWPRRIPLLKPLALQVDTEGVDVLAVRVDFEGVDMDMGPNKVQLIAQDMTAPFKGKAILPACSHQKMEWQANVLLTTKQGVIKVPFRFYTLKK